MRLPGWAWLPVGVVVGLAAARLLLTPRIVDHWPAAGASVPATAEIRITFNQAMDEASVLERLHLEPVQASEVRWLGSTLIVRPLPGWIAGETVEVRLDAGARSRRGLAMLTATRWAFGVSPPRLVYLWPADGPAQIYAWAPGQADAVALTAAPAGVTDFSMGGRGTSLAYIAATGEGSVELRELDLARGQDRRWFVCSSEERCTSPELSPDGTRLAFVRAPSDPGTPQQGKSRVWLLEKGKDAVAVSAEGDVASTPFWSPQGWLAFVDSTRGAILIVDPERGDSFAPLVVLPSSLGERGAWSPDGDELIYPDLIPPVETSSHAGGDEGSLAMQTHLFRWEVLTGALTDLTAGGGWQAEDVSPTFTPDGAWLIFGRRSLAAGAWTPGRQLWRMHADGSGARQLTQEAFINHGAPAAGPEQLAYLRFDMQAPGQPAEIWWLDAETLTTGLVTEGGYLPAWVP